MAIIHRTIENTSGIPLGGIGTGSVEIREDGLFHEWQIFNLGQWSPHSPTPSCCGERPCVPTMTPQDFTFILRTETPDGGVKVRRLAMREQLNNLYSFAWLKCVRSIRFRAEYPVAHLEYIDPTLPVTVRAEVFAPVIPHHPRESGTPGFYVRFSIVNTSDEPVKASLLAMLSNPIPCGERIHTVARHADSTMITLSADDIPQDEPYAGAVTLAVTGGEHSHIAGTYAVERTGFGYHSPLYGVSTRSCLLEFRQQGELECMGAKRPPQPLPAGFKAESLSPAARKRLLSQLLEHSLFHQKRRRLAQCDPALLRGDKALCRFLDDIAREMSHHSTPADSWRDAYLCSKTDIAPHDEQAILFTISWHFPNHISPLSGNIGHMYSNWFEDSTAVCRYLTANHDDFRRQTLHFARTLYDTTLDYFLADSISAQLSTLVKCTWWTKADEFGVWEGLGCCGFHTTDITYDGSFSILALFPELQKKQMVLGSRFQRGDGRIPHFFDPDFSRTDGDYARVDMNPQFVLLVARDYLWTRDRKYLKDIWQPTVKAIENSKLLDADNDGLPDHACERQTYDNWELYGTPSYIASLWLGSLKAGILLANAMKDSKTARRWQQWYDKGVRNFEKLWNGEYYVLWKELKPGGRVDECCMTDQIDGDWFTALMGWGNILPPDRIRKALQSIFRYNYNTEDGLKNASYPPGKKPRIVTFENVQAEAPWTGIEYAIASMFIDYGLVREGIEIARNIYERYLRAGRVWNHVECGNHYYRAMSSWALLLSLTGFRVDAPACALTFAPAVRREDFRAPFVSSSSWGTFAQHTGLRGFEVAIECRGGSETIKVLNLSVALKPKAVSAALNGAPVKCAAGNSGGLLRLTFPSPITLHEGDTLAITSSRY